MESPRNTFVEAYGAALRVLGERDSFERVMGRAAVLLVQFVQTKDRRKLDGVSELKRRFASLLRSRAGGNVCDRAVDDQLEDACQYILGKSIDLLVNSNVDEWVQFHDLTYRFFYSLTDCRSFVRQIVSAWSHFHASFQSIVYELSRPNTDTKSDAFYLAAAHFLRAGRTLGMELDAQVGRKRPSWAQ